MRQICARLLAVWVGAALVASGCGSSSSHPGAAAGTSGASAAGSTSSTSTLKGTGADQPGVTPTTITLGVVADVTGPVPGIFKTAPDTMDAFADYVNSTGGIDGRMLKIVREDSAFSCNVTKNVTQQLVSTVFAEVGSFSINDGCAVPVIQAAPDFPDVSYALNPQLAAVANVFSPQPAPLGFATTDFTYLKGKYPDAITKMAWLYNAAASSNFSEQQAAAESVGYRTIYSRGIGPTETNFTADILRMKSEGAQFVDISNIGDMAANFLNEARQQGFHPEVLYDAPAYDAQFFQEAQPDAAQGLWVDQQFAMFLGEDSKTVPEVATFLHWLEVAHPSDKPDVYGAYAWASGLLFEEAMKAAGPRPTRSGLLSALKGIHDFDGNGFIAPADVGNKRPPVCTVVIQVDNGRFVRRLPQQGFYCGNAAFHYSK